MVNTHDGATLDDGQHSRWAALDECSAMEYLTMGNAQRWAMLRDGAALDDGQHLTMGNTSTMGNASRWATPDDVGST